MLSHLLLCDSSPENYSSNIKIGPFRHLDEGTNIAQFTPSKVTIPQVYLTLIRYLVMSLPAISSRLVRCGRAKPSYTGQICVTPSPESTTTPVKRPAGGDKSGLSSGVYK